MTTEGSPTELVEGDVTDDLASNLVKAIEGLPEDEQDSMASLLVSSIHEGDDFPRLVQMLLKERPELADSLVKELIEERRHRREQDASDAMIARENAKEEGNSVRKLRWFVVRFQWFIAFFGLTGAGVGFFVSGAMPVFWGFIGLLAVGGPIAAQLLARNTKAVLTLGSRSEP